MENTIIEFEDGSLLTRFADPAHPYQAETRRTFGEHVVLVSSLTHEGEWSYVVEVRGTPHPVEFSRTGAGRGGYVMAYCPGTLSGFSGRAGDSAWSARDLARCIAQAGAPAFTVGRED